VDTLKDKPKHRTRQSTIDFVIPMQLEEILLHTAKQSPEINISTVSKDDDTASFIAKIYRRGSLWMEIVGTMRRWEGTSTRIEGTITATGVQGLHPKLILPAFSIVIFPALYLLSYALFLNNLIRSSEVMLMFCGVGIMTFFVPFVFINLYSDVVYHQEIKRVLQEAFSGKEA
jgi:hypothetical protein